MEQMEPMENKEEDDRLKPSQIHKHIILNDLDTPLKAEIVRLNLKINVELYAAYKNFTLNIKTQAFLCKKNGKYIPCSQ